ncbi:MAG: hypothetical protein BMS9Abin32_420 [Gammaproteobacteria bacterium]|nr:MAG: hypothetical protein BMS9Abin32_420 [Gammaproteobacteria bacterium]
MNDALKLQISAYIDGELPGNESQLLLRRLSQDAALRAQAAEYLRIGRLIRREGDVPGVQLLRGRIAAALGADVETPVPAPANVEVRFMKPLFGFAIAASVALLALFGLRQLNLPLAPAGEAVVAAGPGITEPVLDEVMDNRLLEMHRRHADLAVDIGANGVLTQLVTLELRDGELIEIAPGTRLTPRGQTHRTGEAVRSPVAESAAGEIRQAR